MANPYTIVSLGGSIVIPKTGFNIPFLQSFKKMILARVKKGERFIFVVGGGATCRVYQDAAKQVSTLSNDDLDWLGIYTTVYNAQFVRMMFKEQAYKDIVQNPRKKVRTTKPIIIAAGEKPGSSTDYRAVLLAKTYGAKKLFNLSNISHVYTKDPNKYKDAKKLEMIDWATFRKDIVGDTWNPGSSAPFDPIASKAAQKMELTVGIIDGTNIQELTKAFSNKRFEGTIIQ